MSEQNSLCRLFSSCSIIQWNSYNNLGLEEKTDENSDSLRSSDSSSKELSMEETSIHMEQNGIQNPTGEQSWALKKLGPLGLCVVPVLSRLIKYDVDL